MKIFDVHLHTDCSNPDVELLLKRMEEAGVWGGCIFSQRPDYDYPKTGLDFEGRVTQVLKWTKDYPDRLFPALWIHPYEENAVEKVKIAADRGIAAFKMMCTTYYPGEEQCLEVLRAIAKTGKPVFFHSGILYTASDEVEINKKNRPVNWEALLTVPGLRFSLAHCSWPWYDEMIAFAGRMYTNRNAYIPEGEIPPSMYYDLSPGGTPAYREDLLTKLYDFSPSGAKCMFGSDQWVENYDPEKSKAILARDNKIFDKLGISLEKRNRMFYQNFLVFMGREDLIQEEDVYPSASGNIRCPYNPQVVDVCKKWYKKLGFPMEYDNEFNHALEEYKISDAIEIGRYDITERDGRRNLLSFLFMCEATEKAYKERGIDEKILLDTLGDIVLWTNVWSEVKGEMYLGELEWLRCHMRLRLFRLGSLEFISKKSPYACPELGLEKGDNVLDVHIPAGADLSPEAVKESLELAKEFYAKHYPEFEFKHFICYSWMMDTELSKLLNPDSKILKFQNMFTLVKSEEKENYSALKYLFKWNTARHNIRNAVCSSGFAEKMKSHILRGGKLNIGVGVMNK